MEASDDRLKALSASVADHLRATLERELAPLVSSAVAAERIDGEERLKSERTAADDRLKSERTASDDRLRAAVDEARAEWLVRERHASLARSERLLAAIRSLDNAASLTDVLDGLVAAARDEAGRAALLVVKGATLRGWAHAGFADSMLPAGEISVPASEAGVLGTAFRTEERATSTDLPWDSRSSSSTPFTLSSDDRVGIAVPLLVDGEPVGVLYADDDGDAERAVPSAWPECVELLVRHAARCLESLTARRASAPAGVKAVPAEATRTDEEGAQRFARLLVSEIKLYHAPLVDEGRRAGDLRQRLHDQIARARQLYEEKVSPAIRRHADYFEQELVRTLADGDPVLLGQRS
jgi:GAF domain